MKRFVIPTIITLTLIVACARLSAANGKTATSFTLDAMDGDLYLESR